MELRKYDDSQKIEVLDLKKKFNLNWVRKYASPAILMSPLLIFIIGFFIVPMLYIFYVSLIVTDGVNTEKAFLGIKNYAMFFTDAYYISALWLTIKISLYTVLICLFLGYPVAYTMWQCSPRVRGYLTLLVASPLLVSIVVRNFGWFLLLTPKGTLNTFLLDLGIITAPLKLLFNEFGVVIGLSNAFIPYMILAIATSLYNIDTSLVRASSILGASPFRSFISIILPLSLPGIVAGSVLVFSISMSSFVTPTLLGGSNIPMLPVLAYREILTLLNWTFGSAISYILLVITLIIVTISTRMFEKSKFKEVFR